MTGSVGTLSGVPLLELAVALERRNRQARQGLPVLLYPLPACPVCGQAGEEVAVDHHTTPERLRIRIEVTWRPCGHAFLAGEEEAYDAARRASRIADQDRVRWPAEVSSVGEQALPRPSAEALEQRYPGLRVRIGDAILQAEADRIEHQRVHGPCSLGPDSADYVLAVLADSYVPPPPGSDRDVLPDRILALIGPWMPPYESTYCQVERALERAVEAHPEAAGELSGWVRRAHDWCRATRKQDMARCVCPRH